MQRWVANILLLIFLLPGNVLAQQEVSGAFRVPDSLLTISQAYTYNITCLDSSLAIIRTMRQRKMEPEWRLNLTEGDLYCNVRQIQKGLPYYERALADSHINDSLRMALNKRMMDAYDLIHDDDHLTYYIFQLKELAEKKHSNHYLALAEFMAGKRFHFQGDKKQGYAKCLSALELMKSSTHERQLNELRSFYGTLTKMYAQDMRYHEALKFSVLHEEAACETSKLKIQKVDARALRHVYGLRASVLAHAGRQVEADAAYALWQQTTGGNAIDDTDILDYLIIYKHHEEALEIVRRCREFLASMGDELSYWNLRMIFNEVQLLTSLKQYEQASDYIDDAAHIADSLHIRASRIEMNTIYRLLEQQKKMHLRTLAINWIIALLLLAALVGGIVFYYTRQMRERNRRILRIFNRLSAYSHVPARSGKASSDAGPSDNAQPSSTIEQAAVDAGETPTKEYSDDDERLFVEMDRRVSQEFLFLQQDLDREKLMQLIGVDKNRFGRMMSKYSTNTSVYINTKRVEFGAQLIVNHPEYTIASIAESCGMRNTVTFNRTFKDVYGVTPSEYRANQESLSRNGGGNGRSH